MIVWYDPFLKPFKNYLADFSCFPVPPNSAMLSVSMLLLRGYVGGRDP